MEKILEINNKKKGVLGKLAKIATCVAATSLVALGLTGCGKGEAYKEYLIKDEAGHHVLYEVTSWEYDKYMTMIPIYNGYGFTLIPQWHNSGTQTIKLEDGQKLNVKNDSVPIYKDKPKASLYEYEYEEYKNHICNSLDNRCPGI